jgi:hypothetical protein
MRHPIQSSKTILYENVFQNPQIFQQTISLFPEHSTLVKVNFLVFLLDPGNLPPTIGTNVIFVVDRSLLPVTIEQIRSHSKSVFDFGFFNKKLRGVSAGIFGDELKINWQKKKSTWTKRMSLLCYLSVDHHFLG